MYRTFDKKRQVIELVRNPQFLRGSDTTRPDGFPDAILIRHGYGADGAVRAVERGQADLASIRIDNSLGVRAEVRVRYRGLLHSNPGLGVQGAVLNTRIPPFNDRRARQAFNYAVDRRRLVALAGADLVTSTCQFLPPNLAGYHRYCPYTVGGDPDGPYVGPDPVKARHLLAASHTRGERVVFRETAMLGPTPITTYLVSVLRGLGYRVRIARGDPTPRDQVASGGWGLDYPDASDLFLPIAGCGSPGSANPFHFCDRGIEDEMAHALALEIDRPQAAARLWAKVDRDVTDEAPWVPYLNQGTVDIVRAVSATTSSPRPLRALCTTSSGCADPANQPTPAVRDPCELETAASGAIGAFVLGCERLDGAESGPRRGRRERRLRFTRRGPWFDPRCAHS